jgi:hypothetical protein
LTLSCRFIKKSSSTSSCRVEHRTSMIIYRVSWLWTMEYIALNWKLRKAQRAACPGPTSYLFFMAHHTLRVGAAPSISLCQVYCASMCTECQFSLTFILQKNRFSIKKKILLFKKLSKIVFFL